MLSGYQSRLDRRNTRHPITYRRFGHSRADMSPPNRGVTDTDAFWVVYDPGGASKHIDWPELG